MTTSRQALRLTGWLLVFAGGIAGLYLAVCLCGGLLDGFHGSALGRSFLLQMSWMLAASVASALIGATLLWLSPRASNARLCPAVSVAPQIAKGVRKWRRGTAPSIPDRRALHPSAPPGGVPGRGADRQLLTNVIADRQHVPMPDAHGPLTADEIKMARDLCDLVTSWTFGCTVEQAHAIMDGVWNERAARPWYERAAELRDRQMASMVRAVEDDDP